MKNLSHLIAILLFILMSISATALNPDKDLVGEWKFDVTKASYEFQKGKMVIEQSGDQLEGKIIFQRAQEVTISDIQTGKRLPLPFTSREEGFRLSATLKRINSQGTKRPRLAN